MMNTNSEKVLHFDPIVRLSEIADKFISQDNKYTNMKSSLQECIDTLANYQDECKKLKKLSVKNQQDDSDKKDINLLGDIYSLYESAYIYYKIIHIIVLNRIPNLQEFAHSKSQNATKEEEELLKIYNMLVKTLLNDDKIQHIKTYLRNNQVTKNHKTTEEYKKDINKELINTELFNLPLSGSGISAIQLNHLIQIYNDTLLVIDVRPRMEFEESHIKCKNIICIEPVSFNESFTDLELQKKSMITSPSDEVKTFAKKDTFNYIVICTDTDEKKQFYLHQQLVLLDLLMNKSFTKPMFQKNVKIFILEKGFKNWVYKKGECEASSPITDVVKPDFTTTRIQDNNKLIEKPEIQKQSGDSIYIEGNTSALNLQKLPELTANVGYAKDNSMRVMMNSSSNFSYSKDYHLPLQQSPLPQRTPSFKSLFNRNGSIPTVSQNGNPAASPYMTKYSNSGQYNINSESPHKSPSTSQITNAYSLPVNSKPSINLNISRYPETPNLSTVSTNNMNIHNNTMGPISPINSRVITPSSRLDESSSPGHRLVPINSSELYNIKSIENYKPSSGSTMKPLLLKSATSKPPSQSLPSLPQLPSASDTLKSYTNSDKDYDFSIGLENMGNSCYLNCIIQCLLSSHEFTRIFLNNSYEKHINLKSKLGSKGVLARNFARLINTMYTEGSEQSKNDRNGPVKPAQFKLACGSINSIFRSDLQQDSQEFCQFLLDGLHEDLNQCGANPPLKELSPNAEKMREKLSLRIASSIEWERYLTTDFSVIVDQFQGQYASQLRCKVCGGTSTTYQAFSVLSVPVPRGKSCNIIDCFNEFTKVENLETDELWACPHCKKKQPSTKKLTITRLPRNLIIHLKRFDNMLNKNNIFVKYPFLLDLTPYWANDFDGRLPPGVTEELPTRGQIPPFNYKLNAVAAHFGSLYGGHYTSYVDKGKFGWRYFDDTKIRPLKNSYECITSNAYVLFYHRVYGV
ncbi:hypothetical protein TPHA_0C02770 [Tetrapisispora phaffii CBS 4417]|uniref:Ubiquitin carboxyl-terminal hydrolase n=1 Tax=Tetrapisispora phaffii (strain ATCC 24235 / CBS 4417 / NBRC 1672 / NRRL Y-8282 / UCD 70-5) TaxID=1071381 RepID=G8BRQ4_TETPH|nr:hypothetical protein TPHA_0C02770 [Tetrapisispora phaffii CBS 4417]CCE62430.1 hypothetical protein TPHA_0C02770 [Tetrapisispora phaffii CBS 4417]